MRWLARPWLPLLAALLLSPGLGAQQPVPLAEVVLADAGRIEIAHQGLRLLGRRAGGQVLWQLDLDPAASVPGALLPACPAQLQATLHVEDGNADGRIDAARGEQALLLLTARWQSASDGSRSLVAAVDIGPGPTARLRWRQDDASLTALADPVAAPGVGRLRIGALNRDPASRVAWLGAGLPRPAQMRSDGSTQAARPATALLALDLQDGTLLWSAMAQGGSQTWPGFTQALTGAVTVLDLDGNGQTDRLYVGDHGARLWRLDVQPGAAASALLAGRVLADLADPAAPGSRMLVAAADVSWLPMPGLPPGTLTVALGTAQAAGRVGSAQAFFVLRDPQALRSLDATQHAAWPPISGHELPIAMAPAGSPPPAATLQGYQIPLGSDQVLSRSLTLDGAVHFAQVAGSTAAGQLCRDPTQTVIVKISVQDASTGATRRDLDGNGRVDEADRSLSLPAAAEGGHLQQLHQELLSSGGCRLAGRVLAGCPPLPRWRFLYWRRSDAD
jgi:hypothetical protein